MARSAGDTWDIVTSVGFTALAVCAARALDAALRPPLANDAFAAGFVAAAGEPNLIAAVDNADMSSAAAFNAQWVGCERGSSMSSSQAPADPEPARR